VERLVLLSPVPGQSPPYKITACDACGSSDDLVGQLGKRLGPQMTVSNGRAGLRSKGLGLQDRPEEARAIAATAVAMTGIGPDRPPVDFLNPRVGVKKAVSHKRMIVWGAGIAAACLIGLVVLLAFWHAYATDIAADTDWLQEHNDEIAAAQQAVDQGKYAGSWLSIQPQFLECLKDLTETFPEEPYVWAGSLALSENGTGSVVGKTTSEAGVYEVLDKIKQNKEAFSDVSLSHIRDAGRDSRDKDFAIKFKFRGVK
jgi:hypothetical protein